MGRRRSRGSSSTHSPSSTTFESTRAGDDDLRSISLLAKDRGLGARLAALHATAGDDPPRGEGLVRPQHVGELHVQAAAQVEAAAEMPGQELGDTRDRHAAPDHRISETELLRGGLVVVIVPAAVEELVTHRFGKRLAELDRQRLPGGLVPLPRAVLARRIAQGDFAAGLLRQEALMMDATRNQVPGLVSHPHLQRDDDAIAPPVAIGHSRAAAQDLSNARRRMDLPFLTPPQVAEEVVEVPALELAVRLLVDDHRSHRSAKGRRRRVPGVRFVEPLDVVLNHLVGNRQLERAEILARIHVSRHHECNPPGHAPADAPARLLIQQTHDIGKPFAVVRIVYAHGDNPAHQIVSRESSPPRLERSAPPRTRRCSSAAHSVRGLADRTPVTATNQFLGEVAPRWQTSSEGARSSSSTTSCSGPTTWRGVPPARRSRTGSTASPSTWPTTTSCFRRCRERRSRSCSRTSGGWGGRFPGSPGSAAAVTSTLA